MAKSPKSQGCKQLYNCPKCKDNLFVYEERNGCTYAVECECRAEVINREQLKRSGLSKAFEKWNFNTFIPRNAKQQVAYDVCKDYAENGDDLWLYLGGQSGFGKTHLATSVCEKLIKNAPLKYVSWTETIKPLKFKQTSEDYETTLTPIKQIKILYLDDLFKSKQGDKEKITGADIQVMFEILDYRVKAELKTIITCEYMIEELAEIDEALAGRIAEMSDRFMVSIKHDTRENQRLNKVVRI